MEDSTRTVAARETPLHAGAKKREVNVQQRGTSSSKPTYSEQY